MKNLLETTPTTGRPIITVAVQFDPWPFEDDSIEMSYDVNYINRNGTYEDTNRYYLMSGEDDVLVTLSNGTQCVSSVRGVVAYGIPS